MRILLRLMDIKKSCKFNRFKLMESLGNNYGLKWKYWNLQKFEQNNWCLISLKKKIGIIKYIIKIIASQ